MDEPRAEYARRLEARRGTVAHLERRDGRIANLRLLVFLVGIGCAWLAFARPAVAAWWPLLPPAVVFLGLMVVHERTLRAKARAAGAVAHYERGLARLDGHWAGQGVTDLSLAPDDHPYAADLDLFGSGSLFDLLCTAQTQSGRHTLAAWLCEPAPVDTVRARQEAVEELRGNLDLREDLALYGDELRARVHPRALTAWATRPLVLQNRMLQRVAVVLAGGAVACAAGGVGAWAVGWFVQLLFFGLAFLVFALLEVGFWRLVRDDVRTVVGGVDAPSRELLVLGEVLARLDREAFSSAELRALQERLRGSGPAAVDCIRRLGRLVAWLDARLNQLFALVAPVLLWDFQCAVAIERWRARHGAEVARWLDAVGELEALCAFAAYAYEHPADPFPEFVEEGPLLQATGLGHPLLAADVRVRNDVRLDATRQLMLVSGSNMSGKSTWLRTIGTNVVLALAGAPVCAERMSLSPLAVGASIRAMDSLQAGESRFYAEIRRLSRIVESTAGPTPVLFLLDELLHGTNSHDRSLGAAGVVRGLLAAGAIGLVTTHDLALAKMAEDLGESAANVHFADELVDGQLVFDYRLRPGVVQHSNAIALMRAVGLDV